jgi:hypothetical protein
MHWYNPLPQVKFTERPDVVAAHLMEGHIAIIVDTSPSVMLLPVTMSKILMQIVIRVWNKQFCIMALFGVIKYKRRNELLMYHIPMERIIKTCMVEQQQVIIPKNS